MTAKKMAQLRDAEPAPWQGERKPDPTPAELRLGETARRFAASAVAVEDHEGPRAGPEYAMKVAAWRHAYAELIQAGRAIPAEEIQ